jgi:hypothetical protein
MTGIDIFIGAVFVWFSALERFNTPPTNRWSTTTTRYYTAVACYLVVGLGLYFGLLSFPALLRYVQEEMGFLLRPVTPLPSMPAFAGAPLVALLLTVLLPKIPILSEADSWIRARLQRMGAIPHEVGRLAAELEKADFAVAPRAQAEVRSRLISEGFAPETAVFEASHSLRYQWSKISTLTMNLESWESDRRFTGFLALFASDFKVLKERRQHLGERVNLCLRWMHNMPDGRRTKHDEVVLHVQKDLTRECAELLKDLYAFVSRGLLQCGLTQRARAAKLESLGFDPAVETQSKLTLNHLMSLFGLVGIVALIPSLYLAPAASRMGERLEGPVLIAILYSLSAFCAVYLKDHWAAGRKGDRRMRPTALYFAAGALAAVLSLAIRLVFQLLHYGFRWREAWEHFAITAPWTIAFFAAAFMVAWMTDDEPTPKLTRGRLRWIEAAAGAGTLLCAALIVHPWLAQLAASHVGARHQPPPLGRILGLCGTVGFVIGYLIPTWYREAPREEAEPAARLQPAANAA